MKQVDIAEAQAAFLEIIEQAAGGEQTLITKDGKPIAMVSPAPRKRLGTLKGMVKVPDDIKTPYEKEIEEMFYGKAE